MIVGKKLKVKKLGDREDKEAEEQLQLLIKI